MIVDTVKQRCEEAGVRLLYLTQYGSRLYGTNTPESDTDYKGVFLPSVESLILGRAPNTLSFSTKSSGKSEKNTKDDVDGELYSLHKFLDLLKKGDTNAVSILYSYTNLNAVEFNLLWMKNLAENNQLVSRNLSGMAGYVKSQVYKYSLKGLKYRIVQQVLTDFAFKHLTNSNGKMKLEDFLEKFGGAESYINDVSSVLKQDDISKYLSVVKIPNPDDTVGYYLNVLEVKLNFRETIERHIQVLETLLDKFGDRAKQAAEDGFADKKAIYHAFRVLYEIQELHRTGKLNYPVLNKDFLLEIRNGLHNLEDLGPVLEDELELCRQEEQVSLLPEKISGNLHDRIILINYADEGLTYSTN